MLIKLFAGFCLTSELKSHLSQSKIWKQDSSIHVAALIEIEHEGQRYIGRLLQSDRMHLDEIKACELETKQLLQTYCPEANLDTQTLHFIPQLFIG